MAFDHQPVSSADIGCSFEESGEADFFISSYLSLNAVEMKNSANLYNEEKVNIYLFLGP